MSSRAARVLLQGPVLKNKKTKKERKRKEKKEREKNESSGKLRTKHMKTLHAMELGLERHLSREVCGRPCRGPDTVQLLKSVTDTNCLELQLQGVSCFLLLNLLKKSGDQFHSEGLVAE